MGLGVAWQQDFCAELSLFFILREGTKHQYKTVNRSRVPAAPASVLKIILKTHQFFPLSSPTGVLATVFQ